MIEQLLQGHLDDLRDIRENARSVAERGVGPDGDEDEEDVDLDLELLIPGGMPTSGQPPPNPETRERSPSPPQEYHGMYS